MHWLYLSSTYLVSRFAWSKKENWVSRSIPWKYIDFLDYICLLECAIRVADSSFHVLSHRSQKRESVWNEETAIRISNSTNDALLHHGSSSIHLVSHTVRSKRDIGHAYFSHDQLAHLSLSRWKSITLLSSSSIHSLVLLLHLPYSIMNITQEEAVTEGLRDVNSTDLALDEGSSDWEGILQTALLVRPLLTLELTTVVVTDGFSIVASHSLYCETWAEWYNDSPRFRNCIEGVPRRDRRTPLHHHLRWNGGLGEGWELYLHFSSYRYFELHRLLVWEMDELHIKKPIY